MGKLIALKETAPGDVVYMRPDHGVFNPGHFAVVVVNDAPATRVVYLDATQTARALFVSQDGDRCVERVGLRFAANCEGLTREELARVCAALRADDMDRDPGADETEIMRRVVNAYRAEERAKTNGDDPYGDPAITPETVLRLTEGAEVSRTPPMLDPGPTPLDCDCEPVDTEAPSPWANKAGPFGDP